MMKLTDKQIAKWAKIKERGMWRFVLLRGALLWGLCVAAPVLALIHLGSGLPGLWFVLTAWLFCSVAHSCFIGIGIGWKTILRDKPKPSQSTIFIPAVLSVIPHASPES